MIGMGKLSFSEDHSGVSELIETSAMSEGTRDCLRYGWKWWLEWCRELCVGPLEPRGPELLGLLQGNHTENYRAWVLWAVRFGYEKSGLLSPTWDMEVRRFRGAKNVGDRPLADYRSWDQRMLKLRTDDYLRWCRENGRDGGAGVCGGRRSVPPTAGGTVQLPERDDGECRGVASAP